jgi:hypothetical protein
MSDAATVAVPAGNRSFRCLCGAGLSQDPPIGWVGDVRSGPVSGLLAVRVSSGAVISVARAV